MATQETTVTSPVSSSLPHHLSTRSPRSSLDSSPRTPNSPFLHSLSNRFRKGSNASNFSTSSDRPPQQTEVEKVETAQSAKHFVLSVVRNDWEYPVPEGQTASGGENISEAEHKQDSLVAEREPTGWRTRFEGASDLDLDLEPVAVAVPGKRKSKRNSDPYRFENPDAIANVIQEQRHKRRRANAEEASWNEGLRFWTKQRDAWTAAQAQKPKRRISLDTHESHRPFSPLRAHHKPSRSIDEASAHEASHSDTNGVVNGGSRHVSLAVDDPNDPTEEEGADGPYLPIFPPLFPTSHTLRARIKPAAYPTIYSKVVVQSLAPNVPIPLTHMIGALVDGWKAEGNWPPQTLAEQKQYALLKRAKGSKKGESAFQKWRRERDAERGYQRDVLQDGFAEELVDDEGGKKGFRRSISGAVRKVLGIHSEEDEDGGLAKLGLSFGNGDDDTGLMKESKKVAEDNVLLNKGLLEGI